MRNKVSRFSFTEGVAFSLSHSSADDTRVYQPLFPDNCTHVVQGAPDNTPFCDLPMETPRETFAVTSPQVHTVRYKALRTTHPSVTSQRNRHAKRLFTLRYALGACSRANPVQHPQENQQHQLNTGVRIHLCNTMHSGGMGMHTHDYHKSYICIHTHSGGRQDKKKKMFRQTHTYIYLPHVCDRVIGDVETQQRHRRG